VNGDSIPIRDSHWGGSGTQLVYKAEEMAAAAQARVAVHEHVPPHSWALLVLYPTKTWDSFIQCKAGML
jgi:hypothetical protein